MLEDELDALFTDAGYRGMLSVLDIDGPAQISLRADDTTYAASTFKIAVGLELLSQCADGELDPSEPMNLTPADRTLGGQGLSIFEDTAEISLRDLARLMLTISDNTATDAVIRRVTPQRVAARLAALGLERTDFACTIRDHFQAIGRELGFDDLAHFNRTLATAAPEQASKMERDFRSIFLQPGLPPCTTAAEMARLVRMIWRDEAGPPPACATLRAMLGQQRLTRKIATGFSPEIHVATKSGTVLGAISNDVGAVLYPDGRRYAVAIFTQTLEPNPAATPASGSADTVIGAAARMAVEHLRSTTG